jgi:AraC family transcriptional regulator of adaptative response / DNA-3-methyladenine glycosylase II
VKNSTAQRNDTAVTGTVTARADARLDHDVCYQAVRRRDRRFDGRFYTAVKTTGIFCRPSCPARTPAARNVTFYAHAAGAIDAGFRPCRRCRPELAPAHPEWNRRAELASRAMALIEQGVVDREGVTGLAHRLGVSERHLRRELIKEVGTGPYQLAQVRRLWLARALLDQTTLSITDIAFAAGFSSIRQFNDAFAKAFAATPSELRRRPARIAPAENERTVTLRLASRGRLQWPQLASFLAARAIPGLESFEGGAFRRNVPGGWVELTGTDDALVVTCSLEELGGLSELIPTVRVVADLDTDLDAVTEHLHRDPTLAAVAGPTPRLPGTFDRFELAIRAVIGQQVSVAAARTTLGKLLDLVEPTEVLDPADVSDPTNGVRHPRFPSPEAILASPLDRLGMPAQRRATICRLTQAVVDEQVDLSPEADPAATEAQLLAVRGIGPWTAGYITMRAFSHPDGWPADDLIVARRIGLSGRALDTHADAWRPWRAYAALAVWAA